jgi:hypothetical protein
MSQAGLFLILTSTASLCAIEFLRTELNQWPHWLSFLSLVCWSLFLFGYVISWMGALGQCRIAAVAWWLGGAACSSLMLLGVAFAYGIIGRGAHPDQIWTYQGMQRSLNFENPIAFTGLAQHYFEPAGMLLSMIPGALFSPCSTGSFAAFLGPAMILGLLVSLGSQLLLPNQSRFTRFLFTLLTSALMVNRLSIQALYTFPYAFAGIVGSLAVLLWALEADVRLRMSIVSLLGIPAFLSHFIGIFNLFPILLLFLFFDLVSCRKTPPLPVLSYLSMPLFFLLTTFTSPEHSLVKRLSELTWATPQPGAPEQALEKIVSRSESIFELLETQRRQWFVADQAWFNFLDIAPLSSPIWQMILCVLSLLLIKLDNRSRLRFLFAIASSLTTCLIVQIVTDNDLRRFAFAGFLLLTVTLHALVLLASKFPSRASYIAVFVCLISLVSDSAVLSRASPQQYLSSPASFDVANLIAQSDLALLGSPTAIIGTLEDLAPFYLVPGDQTCASKVPVIRLWPRFACESSLDSVYSLVPALNRGNVIWAHNHKICDLTKMFADSGMQEIWRSADGRTVIHKFLQSDLQQLKKVRWSSAPYGLTMEVDGYWSLPIEQEWGRPLFDKALNGDKIIVEGQTYERGVCSHARGLIKFNLDGNCSRFSFTAAVPDYLSSSPWLSIQFSVAGDQKLLWESPVVTKGGKRFSKDLSVNGMKELSLILKDVDGVNFEDHGCWLDLALACSK